MTASVLESARNRVWPSAGVRRTSLNATTPVAPGLLSTTTGWRQRRGDAARDDVGADADRIRHHQPHCNAPPRAARAGSETSALQPATALAIHSRRSSGRRDIDFHGGSSADSRH
ncbi:MAG TPA: hypothetical protein VMT83_05190, partial [Burkholderiaceae bacterium]|nr:hypothetical protein [Burkholderiaceae bacterium]